MTLEYIEKLIMLIEQHGLSLVLLIAMIVLWFIPWVKKMQLGEGGVESQYISEIIGVENNITEVLGQMANELNCQWAVLWQFHNGISSMDGVPFIKMSVTHEYSDNDVEPRLPLYQGIPISVFIDALLALKQEGKLSVDWSSKFISVVNSYKRDGVKHGSFVRVNNSSGKMVGVLSAGWSEEGTPSEQDIISMNGYSARISILLTELAHFKHLPNRRRSDIKQGD